MVVGTLRTRNLFLDSLHPFLVDFAVVLVVVVVDINSLACTSIDRYSNIAEYNHNLFDRESKWAPYDRWDIDCVRRE